MQLKAIVTFDVNKIQVVSVIFGSTWH